MHLLFLLHINMISKVYSFFCVLYVLIKWAIVGFLCKTKSESLTCMVGKTAIVTGGNSGIGYAISCLLASRGCKVIIADIADSKQSRDKIIELTRNKNVTTKYLNLSSLEEIRKFAEDINKNEKRIDILINNAGIGVGKQVTNDGLNEVMQINCFGSFLLTHLLLDSFRAAGSARVIFTGSVMSVFSKLSLDNVESNLNPIKYKIDNLSIMAMTYQNSKLMNVLAAQEFAKKLREHNVFVYSYDPGAIRTPLMYYTPYKYREWYMRLIVWSKLYALYLEVCCTHIFDGAETAFHLAISENLKEDTGQYYYRCKKFEKPRHLKDQVFCNKVWSQMEDLVRLKPEEQL